MRACATCSSCRSRRCERPPLPFPEEDEYEEDEDEGPAGPSEQETGGGAILHPGFSHRNIQRKKEKELAELQLVGGDVPATAISRAINNNKVGRNDPCPCGSGKKYKKCHGQAA